MRRHSQIIFSTARIILALAGIFFVANLLAQDDESQIQSRYLFVFSTSAEMKNRTAATQAEINQLLALSMNGALHTGDSIGVWTFAKNVHFGQFPLRAWNADDAAGIAKNLNKFVREQRYAGTNNFNALLPVLERVIQISPRLTILIFCDGGGEISGTPYDDEINSVFKQRFVDQKKSHEPFIIVLRTQFGRYVGSSVNFPPGMVNLPTFPPLSKPTPPTLPPVVTNMPPPEPTAPLVIIGKRVETNWGAYQFVLTNTSETPEPPTTQMNSSSGNAPIEKENSPSETNLSASENLSTNAEVKSLETNLPSDNSILKTNAISLPENQSPNRNGALALGAGFLIGAIALSAIFFFRSRRDRGSLISRSMHK